MPMKSVWHGHVFFALRILLNINGMQITAGSIIGKTKSTYFPIEKYIIHTTDSRVLSIRDLRKFRFKHRLKRP